MVLGLNQPIALGISCLVFVRGFSQHRNLEPQQILLSESFMCQPLFSLKILGIQKTVILPFPLLLAANALQKVW